MAVLLPLAVVAVVVELVDLVGVERTAAMAATSVVQAVAAEVPMEDQVLLVQTAGLKLQVVWVETVVLALVEEQRTAVLGLTEAAAAGEDTIRAILVAPVVMRRSGYRQAIAQQPGPVAAEAAVDLCRVVLASQVGQQRRQRTALVAEEVLPMRLPREDREVTVRQAL